MTSIDSSFIAATLCVAMGIAATAAAQDPPSDLRAITHVGIVDVRAGTIIPDATVVIDGGWIRSVEASGTVPDDADVIDATGKYLIPGLWDMHVHIRHEAAPDLIMPQFVAHGVTGVRDMSSDCDGPTDGKVGAGSLSHNGFSRGCSLGPRLIIAQRPFFLRRWRNAKSP